MDGCHAGSQSVAMTENVTTHTGVRRLERSRSDHMLAGVCGGLARYFDLSPVFYRVGFVVLTLLGGAGLLIYAAAWLVIPEEGKADSIAGEILRERRQRPWPLIGLALVGVAGAVLLSRATLWPQGDVAWVLLLLAGGVILLAHRRRPSSDDATSIAKGRRRWGRTLAVVTAVLLVLVLAASAAIATAFHVDVRDGVGERIYQPDGAGDVHERYRLGVGVLRLDLAGIRLPVGETEVDARVGIGELTIIVPKDVALRVQATAQLGAAHVAGRSDDGRNARVRVDGSGARVLVLRARVGLGDVRVSRALR